MKRENDLKYFLLIFLGFCILTSEVCIAADDAGDILTRIKKKYESLNAVCADFHLTSPG